MVKALILSEDNKYGFDGIRYFTEMPSTGDLIWVGDELYKVEDREFTAQLTKTKPIPVTLWLEPV